MKCCELDQQATMNCELDGQVTMNCCELDQQATMDCELY